MNTNFKKFIFSFLFVFPIILIILPKGAQASSIGVTPGIFDSQYLLRGSHIERTFIISRKEPVEDIDIHIEKYLGDMDGWTKFEPGESFTIDKGIQNYEFKVIVDVPEDAVYKNYSGSFRIIAGATEEGQIAIEQGIQINVNFRVSDIPYVDMIIRNITIDDFFSAEDLILHFQVENNGNASDSPDEITIRIYNTDNTFVREITTSEIPLTNAFSTADVEVTFENVDIPAATYRGEVIMVNNNQEIFNDSALFNVFEARKGEEGEGIIPPVTGEIVRNNWGYVFIVCGGSLIIFAFIILFIYYKRNRKDKKSQRDY